MSTIQLPCHHMADMTMEPKIDQMCNRFFVIFTFSKLEIVLGFFHVFSYHKHYSQSKTLSISIRHSHRFLCLSPSVALSSSILKCNISILKFNSNYRNVISLGCLLSEKNSTYLKWKFKLQLQKLIQVFRLVCIRIAIEILPRRKNLRFLLYFRTFNLTYA